MTSYLIPIRYPPYEKSNRSARLLHMLVSFLFLGNAWGEFQQPNPSLIFVVSQIALSVIVFVFSISGKKMIPNRHRMNRVFRLIEAIGFAYAAWHFLSVMNLYFTGSLQVVTVACLIYLMITENPLYREVRIELQDKGVYVPGNTGMKLLAWGDIENMRIRNDFISVNMKDNRFLQYEIDTILKDADIDEMNAWCLERFTGT